MKSFQSGSLAYKLLREIGYKEKIEFESLFVAINSPQSQTTTPGITPIIQLGQSTNLGSIEWPWEEGVTKNGERYYINHLTRTTHWRDPRLCMLFTHITHPFP